MAAPRKHDPKHPTRPVPFARIVACMDFAILQRPLGYWSYLARFADNAAYKLPDPYAWIDIPEALQDATAMMQDLARLAALTEGGEARVRQMIAERIAALEARAEAAAAEGAST